MTENRLPNETLDNAIGVYKTSMEAYKGDEEHISALDKATIQFLEELKQYRAIGTVEECQSAVERMKPKMADFEGDGYWDGKLVYDTWICPNCGKKYELEYEEYKHCPECGQAISGLD